MGFSFRIIANMSSVLGVVYLVYEAPEEMGPAKAF